MYLRSLSLFFLILIYSFSSYSQGTEGGTPQGYLVGPGDEITGKVLGESQFDFVATVDEDGRIEVPFFDKPVMARCLSERQLRADITKLLSKYLKNPQISLRVTKRNSRPPVTIHGEVREPSKVDLTRRGYLMELISFAGGPTEKSGGTVQVFRPRAPICASPDEALTWKTAGKEDLGVPSQLYSFSDIRAGRQDANPEIFPGDIIYVPKSSPVYVTGEVIRPGEMSIPEGGLRLTQAIAMASGITREAKTKNVKVYRRKSGAPQPEVLAVNYDQIKKGTVDDLLLQPFDIVEVDKAKKSFLDVLYEAAVGIPGRLPIPIRPF